MHTNKLAFSALRSLCLAAATLAAAGSLQAQTESGNQPLDRLRLEAAPSERIVFEGRVLDARGAPAAGAVVLSNEGGQAVTRLDGSFRLEVALPRAVDSVRVTAVADGYSASTQVFPPASGGTMQLDPLALAPLDGGLLPDWLPTFGGAPGLNGGILVNTVYDDGTGPALYAGGTFTSAGGVEANYTAKWDGSKWSALGTGMDHGVFSMTVYDDGSGPVLVAGGDFTIAGGVLASHVARWDGSSWSAMGSGMDDLVMSLRVYDDGGGPVLYAGGWFTVAGGQVVHNIALWNGVDWEPVGGGMSGGNKAVWCLTVFDDGTGPGLYAGGSFLNAGGVPVNRIARWDGASWSALGSGMDFRVFATAVWDDGSGSGPALFVGGDFSTAGGVPANQMAKWDGSSWSALGGGITGPGDGPEALAVFDDGGGPELYVAGTFTRAGPVQVNNLAKWDGATWTDVGGGTNKDIYELPVWDDGSGNGPALYLGGDFTLAGGVAARFAARWDGVSFSSLGGGINDDVLAVAVFNDGGGPALYAAGDFISIDGVPINRIAKWDGAAWSALGSGLSGGLGTVYALAGFNQALYAGGDFLIAGGMTANHIARWDGASWSPVSNPSGANGTDQTVFALKVHDDGTGGGPALFAGGAFVEAGGVFAPRVARWNGTVWSGLGAGLDDTVQALESFNDGTGPGLYAGGVFLNAGGAPARNIAKWDGLAWAPLGLGIDGVGSNVAALRVYNGLGGGNSSLYVGGDFTLAGGLPATNVARWNGVDWSPLGSGLSGGTVSSFGVFNDGTAGGPELYAGGRFATVAGAPGEHVAKWNGSTWSPLGAGVNADVRGFIDFNDGTGPALFIGGRFTVSPAADSFMAKWGVPPPPPPFTFFCTAKTALFCGPANIGATGTPSATATSGFVVDAQPVRGCRAGLLLYSNQPVQPGIPFGGPGDGVLCLFPSGLRRAGPIDAGGTSPQVCDGILAIDVNQFASFTWTAVGCSPPPGQNNPAGFLSNPGTTVSGQVWGRDSITTGQVLSDGVSWVVGP